MHLYTINTFVLQITKQFALKPISISLLPNLFTSYPKIIKYLFENDTQCTGVVILPIRYAVWENVIYGAVSTNKKKKKFDYLMMWIPSSVHFKFRYV